ncbi:hypothetical protein CVT26_010750 [Gymnopilus dilepis]|uniref:Uncharacterized protein n=1 Tax=Gymnopilus dilepis TaxID=231916 RepID=A0A409Y0R2_9AGAR|nr:hypothetical protein CVT26_010750 [Gymnopilus dilepis]
MLVVRFLVLDTPVCGQTSGERKRGVAKEYRRRTTGMTTDAQQSSLDEEGASNDVPSRGCVDTMSFRKPTARLSSSLRLKLIGGMPPEP